MRILFYVFFFKSIEELDLDDFQYGGTTITGFSLINYQNPSIMKLIGEVYDSIPNVKKRPQKIITVKTSLIIIIFTILSIAYLINI